MTKSSPPYLLISSLIAAPIFIWTLAGVFQGAQHIEVPYLLEQYTLFLWMRISEIIDPFSFTVFNPVLFLVVFLSVLFLSYLIPIYIVVRVLLTGWSSIRGDNVARKDEKRTEGVTPQSHPRSSQ